MVSLCFFFDHFDRNTLEQSDAPASTSLFSINHSTMRNRNPSRKVGPAPPPLAPRSSLGVRRPLCWKAQRKLSPSSRRRRVRWIYEPHTQIERERARYTYLHTHTHIYIYTHIQYTYTYTHTHIYIYICICIYTKYCTHTHTAVYPPIIYTLCPSLSLSMCPVGDRAATWPGTWGKQAQGQRHPWRYPWGCVWKCCVPLNPMVLLIIIPIKWLFHWEYSLFSDKPMGFWPNFYGFPKASKKIWRSGAWVRASSWTGYGRDGDLRLWLLEFSAVKLSLA